MTQSRTVFGLIVCFFLTFVSHAHGGNPPATPPTPGSADDLYKRGTATVQIGNRKDGYDLITQAAKAGNADAIIFLRGVLAMSRNEPGQMVYYLRPMADRGDVNAQCLLGAVYTSGNPPFSRDYPEALRLFQLAAAQGSAEAENDLGMLYEGGVGVPSDTEMALHWYRLAAERGHTDAKKNVARLASGQSPEESTVSGSADELYKRATAVYNRGDTDEGIAFFKQAANAGHADAKAIVAAIHAGANHQPRQVISYIRPLAERGDVNAQMLFGLGYVEGYPPTLPKDYAKALKWFGLAAAQGSAVAEENLGEMYEMGLGVASDAQAALHWYLLAAEKGNADAKEHLAGLSGEATQKPFANGFTIENYVRALQEAGSACAQWHTTHELWVCVQKQLMGHAVTPHP